MSTPKDNDTQAITDFNEALRKVTYLEHVNAKGVNDDDSAQADSAPQGAALAAGGNSSGGARAEGEPPFADSSQVVEAQRVAQEERESRERHAAQQTPAPAPAPQPMGGVVDAAVKVMREEWRQDVTHTNNIVNSLVIEMGQLRAAVDGRIAALEARVVRLTNALVGMMSKGAFSADQMKAMRETLTGDQ